MKAFYKTVGLKVLCELFGKSRQAYTAWMQLSALKHCKWHLHPGSIHSGN